MINVKIYCMKTHREYENVYMVIDDVLKRSRLEYRIERVTEPEELYRRRILFQPHIVINPRFFSPPLSAAGGSRGNLEKNEVDKMKSEIYTAICKK